MLFAQLWGVGGVRILTFTVIPTPFMRTSRRVGAGLGAHFERSLKREILAEDSSAATDTMFGRRPTPQRAKRRAEAGAEPKT